MPAPLLFLGLDVGSTHTRVLADDGSHRQLRVGSGAHLQRDGAPDTAERLLRQIEEAVQTHLVAPVRSLGGICLGVAGATGFEEQHLLRAELQQRFATSRLPALAAAPLAVEHDATVALEAAFAGESGVLMVVGLDAIAYGRTHDSDLLRVGGWGPLLGGEGGSYALGVAALRTLAASMDGGPPSLLSVLLAERHGLLTQADLTGYPSHSAAEVARLAPLVTEAAEKGDWVATSILKQQANALAKQIGWLAARAGDGIEKRIAFTGPLSAPGYYRECIAEALLRHLPRWRIARPQAEPVEGALRLARRLAPDDAQVVAEE